MDRTPGLPTKTTGYPTWMAVVIGSVTLVVFLVSMAWIVFGG